jgi:hypothetical protein
MFKLSLAGILNRLGGQKMPAGTRLGTAALDHGSHQVKKNCLKYKQYIFLEKCSARHKIMYM